MLFFIINIIRRKNAIFWSLMWFEEKLMFFMTSIFEVQIMLDTDDLI